MGATHPADEREVPQRPQQHDRPHGGDVSSSRELCVLNLLLIYLSIYLYGGDVLAEREVLKKMRKPKQINRVAWGGGVACGMCAIT